MEFIIQFLNYLKGLVKKKKKINILNENKIENNLYKYNINICISNIK